MKRILMGVAAVALILTGCSKNEVLDNGATMPQNAIGFGVYTGKPTKAAEMSNTNIKANGNAFGVFAYKHQNAFAAPFVAGYMENQKVTSNGTAFSYDPVKYWPATDKVTFVAYFPHSATAPAITNGEIAIPWTVVADPLAQQDLMWNAQKNKSIADASVTFAFQHALAKVVFKAKTDDKVYTANEFKVTKLEITNIASVGTYTIANTLATGTWSIAATPIAHTIYNDATGVVLNKTTAAEVGVSSLLIPQTIDPANAKLKVSYTYGGETYSKEVNLSKTGGLVWEQNKSYVYTLTLSLDAVSFDASVAGFTAPDTEIGI